MAVDNVHCHYNPCTNIPDAASHAINYTPLYTRPIYTAISTAIPPTTMHSRGKVFTRQSTPIHGQDTAIHGQDTAYPRSKLTNSFGFFILFLCFQVFRIFNYFLIFWKTIMISLRNSNNTTEFQNNKVNSLHANPWPRHGHPWPRHGLSTPPTAKKFRFFLCFRIPASGLLKFLPFLYISRWPAYSTAGGRPSSCKAVTGDRHVYSNMSAGWLATTQYNCDDDTQFAIPI